MKKTGQLLKDKREGAKLSLSEVALATKINPKILTAIENGDEPNLPSKTFLKGFIRAYAVFLKMDVDTVLRSYQEESGAPPVERVHEAYKTGTPAQSGRRQVVEENSSGMRTAAVIVIVVLIGLIIGVRELIEKYQHEKLVETAQPIKISPLQQPPITPGEATKPAEATPEHPPEPPAAASSPAAAAPAQTPAPAVVPPPQPPVADPPKIKAKAEVKPAEPAPAPEAPKDVAITPASSEPSNAAGAIKNEIILEALDNVEVKFQINGEVKTVSLAPPQVHTIHSDQPVTLDISDGGAVNIILNGRERGPPGDLGKPKQIKIP